MNPPDQPAFTITGEAKEGTLAPMSFYAPALAPTPRTDAAYFANGATMYSLAGEMKLIERELAGACSLNALACRKWDAAETKLAAAKAECERLAKPCGWPHCEPAKADAAELTRLRAEVERWKTVAATLSQEREHNANEASRLRAEVERLTAKIGNQADRLRYLEGAINHATGTPLSKANARAEQAEAALAFIAANGGTKHETECGTISCNGSWCAEQALAAMKGTP